MRHLKTIDCVQSRTNRFINEKKIFRNIFVLLTGSYKQVFSVMSDLAEVSPASQTPARASSRSARDGFHPPELYNLQIFTDFFYYQNLRNQLQEPI